MGGEGGRGGGGGPNKKGVRQKIQKLINIETGEYNLNSTNI